MTLVRAWLVALALGCGSATTVVEITPSPSPLALTECAVCGMVANEQPAPRGQLQHRDGSHAHFCSLGDMRAYVQTPTPKGPAIGSWVEALEPDFDPNGRDTAARPWVSTADAGFVVGVARTHIMGPPALSYPSPSAATTAAQRHGGRTTDWAALSTTPFSSNPP